MKKDRGSKNKSLAGYTVFWKYTIVSGNEKTFEHEYGSSGTWAGLFSSLMYYKGSSLRKSPDEHGTYLLMDHWASKEAYTDFIKQNSKIYEELGRKFKQLYKTEVRIGAFVPVI